jgi:hypothetical protein
VFERKSEVPIAATFKKPLFEAFLFLLPVLVLLEYF